MIKTNDNAGESPKKGTFRLHFLLFLIINALLMAINFLFSPQFWWFIFPIFGWLIGIAVHLAAELTKNLFPHMRAFIIHIAVYVSGILFLLIIDYMFSEALTWALYPLIFWGAGLLVHGIISEDYLRKNKSALREKYRSADRRSKKLIDISKSRAKRDKLLKSDQRIPLNSQFSSTSSNNITNPPKQPKKPKTKGSAEKVKKSYQISEDNTAAEVDIEEKEVICVVHKAPIVGTIYICPHCKTTYCYKCAKALQERGEKCWTCDQDLNP